MFAAFEATTAATVARLERQRGDPLEGHLRQMTSLGEFLADKEEMEISDTNEDETNVPQTSETAAVDRSSQIRLQKYMKKLIERDDFRFYFYHNQAIKQSVLSAVAALFKQETHLTNKLEALHLLDDLISAEIDLSGAGDSTMTEPVRSHYNWFYSSILNEIDVIITSLSANKLAAPPNVKYESFIYHLCYMLVCMPSNYEMLRQHTPLLYKVVDFLLETNMCSHLAAKSLLSIAVNICVSEKISGDKKNDAVDYDDDDDDEDQMSLECDQIKIELYEKCSMRCVELMSMNMRDKECRVSLKRALEIYCAHLSNRLVDLTNSSSLNEDSGAKEDKDERPAQRMNHVLYQIVISIVRVLRAEFENHDASIEIELVIYFYEIIKENLDNLAEEDAYDLATKLMDIITKIDVWSETYQDGFTPYQLAYLNELSFELVIKFIHVLKDNFCPIHWTTFNKQWTKAILNWEPLAYKAISTLCDYTDLSHFDYIRKLARRVRNSWLGHPSKKTSQRAKSCQGPFKAKKELGMFLDPEILGCVVKLLSKYDEGVRNQLWYLEAYRADLRPVFEIIGELFGSIGYRDQMLKCLNFFTFFADLTSPPLRSQVMWTKHIDLLIYHIVQITHEKTVFDQNEQLIQAVVKISSILLSEFDLLTDFKHVIVDLVAFVKRKTRYRPLDPDTENDFKKICLLIEQ